MTDSAGKSMDLFGIKPVGESVLRITEGAVAGASAFLGRICLPAAEEFGLLLRDRVSGWRANNAAAIANKALKLTEARDPTASFHAPPRIVVKVIEEGSWAENNKVQDLWAGLLASSCTADGKDDGNLIFIHILSQLNSTQVALLENICLGAPVYVTRAGWLCSDTYTLDLGEIKRVMGLDNIYRLDLELDHLRSLQLIEGGFPTDQTDADVTPTPLCLQLYARCNGDVGSPIDFYGACPKEASFDLDDCEPDDFDPSH